MAGTRAGALKGWATKFAAAGETRRAAAELREVRKIERAERAARVDPVKRERALKGWETRILKQREKAELPPVEPEYYDPWNDQEYYDVEEPMDSTGRKKGR